MGMDIVWSVLSLAAFGYAVYWVYKRVITDDKPSSGKVGGKDGSYPGQNRK